jgi:hypothetical protein
MRVYFAVVASIVMMSAFSPANAEKRVFIIASNTNGYGVDRCLTNGGKCGNAVAATYCHSREFSTAVSFRKVDRDDITGAIPGEKENCPKGVCEDYVAIECSR